MQQRFVILTAPRSGSNMLVSILDAHPQITCFGELMRKTAPDMARDGYRGALKALSRVDPRFRDDEVRFNEAAAFLDEAFTKLASSSIVGFKLMLAQHKDLMRQLIDDPTWTKIVLRRANTLAAYSSEKIAKITGQGSVREGTEVKRAKALFEPKPFGRFMKRRKQQYEGVYSRLEASSQTYLDLEYLELVSGDGVRRILDFLGADPNRAAPPRTIKRNPSNLLERFENPDDVACYLRNNGLSEWQSEGAVQKA